MNYKSIVTFIIKRVPTFRGTLDDNILNASNFKNGYLFSSPETFIQ
jgi:succinylglutamate desuccinylase